MDSSDTRTLATELQRRAVDRFGGERAEALRNDVEQLARELEALQACKVDFEDEP
jgi:hypothetical protein